ncbi:MAG: TonB-dependent receptor [Saprospiraceae bacterium]|nr:TonB-dependent receptor [Saprospiraceae bacterium]
MEENFLKNVKWLSDLKFRVSYGETGNANIGSFSWQNFLRGSNYNFGINRQFGTFRRVFNPDLTWEKNKQFDVGIDIALFKDRVALTADFYDKNTFDMILNKQLPSVVGITPTFNTNTGNLQNRGFELTLTTRNIKTKHFNWTSEINFSRNENLVTDLGGAQNLGFYNAVTGWNNAFLIQVGSPIGDMYGYQIDGIIRNAEEAATVPKYGVGTVLPAAGDMKIRDVNGDNIIDKKDITKIGNSQADFLVGMTHKVTYRNFDLSFVLQGQQGGNIINGLFRNPWVTPGANLPRDMYRNIYIDKDPLGDNANVKYPAVTSRAPILFTNSLTSLAIYDASFLRLRNITFGYKLPNSLTQKLNIQNTRIYVSGQNLFTLSTYPGYNPEVSLNGNSVTQPGVDQGVYPQVKP